MWLHVAFTFLLNTWDNLVQGSLLFCLLRVTTEKEAWKEIKVNTSQGEFHRRWNFTCIIPFKLVFIWGFFKDHSTQHSLKHWLAYSKFIGTILFNLWKIYNSLTCTFLIAIWESHGLVKNSLHFLVHYYLNCY